VVARATRFTLPTAAIAALALAACAKPETADQMAARMQAESDSARTAIEAINVQYARYLTGNLPDSIAMLFTDNGVMMPTGGKAVTGRDSIRAAMTAMPLPPGATLTMRTAEVSANGPIAIERGTYTFAMAAQGRTPAVSLPGKYLVHWHKVNGEWKMAADIWNEDAPPPPAAR
jgi:uncharacterized protein (TIGR02246 family)